MTQVVRPPNICTDELSGKSQVDNDEERVWSTTTTTTTTSAAITTKACAEESTAAAPMKQRKFSFKHGKVSPTDENEDDAFGDGDCAENHLEK